MADLVDDPAVSLYFSVNVDGRDLGAFTSCDGLGFEVSVEQREEGGNNSFVHMLAGRIKYSNIKLTRPVNRDSGKVAAWFGSMAGMVVRTNAEIIAQKPNGEPVATWSVMDVIPVRWTGPQLGVDNAKVATETLELAHHGFAEFGSMGRTR